MPARSRYVAAVLLIAGVTLGFFPLIRATGNFVFAIVAMVLLWLGVPSLVHILLGREARWFAIAANVCPPLSVAFWPDPHNPNKLVDGFTWSFVAALAGAGAVFSVIVDGVLQRTSRQ